MHLHNNEDSTDHWSLSGVLIRRIFSKVRVNNVKFCCR